VAAYSRELKAVQAALNARIQERGRVQGELGLEDAA
jgi:hypothetical protein